MEVYLAACALGVLAVVGVVTVARRTGRAREPDTASALFADRRLELKREADAQDLDANERAALEEELALDHLDESAQLGSSDAEPAGRVPLLPFVAGSLAMFVVAIGLYAVWGEPGAPLLSRASEIMHGGNPSEMRALEDAVESRLAREVGDVNSWFVLGHLRMQLEDYEGAAEAFAALHDVAGPVAEVGVAWAQARYRADGGQMSPATRLIVDRVLAEQPDHPTMLELLAVDALHRGDFPEAVAHLTRVLRQPIAAERRRELAEVLALARTRLPDSTEVDPDPPTAISVAVSLTAFPNVDSGAPVFVIARDPDAPRPPLAVRRLTVGDLPARIVLTDADAMMPGRSLSDLASVELLARVSLSGSPSARTGDLESDVAALEPGGEPVELRIEHRVR